MKNSGYEWFGESDPIHELPLGWGIAFGYRMVKELNDILVKYDIKGYQVLQVKEKYGGLRWYDTGVPKAAEQEYDAWLKKYEELSENTCVMCGSSGVMRTDMGWTSPFCDKHYIKMLKGRM